MTRMSRGAEAATRWKAAAALWMALAAPFAWTDEGEDPRAWLADMSRALRSLDYQGVLVYLHGRQLEAMRLVHRAAGDGEHERIVSLNGVPREVLRDPRRVTCVLPDARAVLVERSRPRRVFPGTLPLDLGRIERHYALVLDGRDRVAGRAARIVEVRARDRYRYGYRFWIDEESRLPLKLDVVDSGGTPIEQMMFTQLQVGGPIPESLLQPALPREGYTWYTEQASLEEGHPGPLAEAGKWTVSAAPPGFELTMRRVGRVPAGRRPVEHLMLSDGLASVSVYIDRPEADEGFMEGLSRMGAMSAFGARVEGYQVTAVGEVPPVTVEMVARSTRRLER